MSENNKKLVSFQQPPSIQIYRLDEFQSERELGTMKEEVNEEPVRRNKS